MMTEKLIHNKYHKPVLKEDVNSTSSCPDNYHKDPAAEGNSTSSREQPIFEYNLYKSNVNRLHNKREIDDILPHNPCVVIHIVSKSMFC